ncbi:MAG: ornithine cyclodeaminase [Gemmatimonadales bacterium]|nr:ornithine cyclodeaminase [Gemmatimonadales bacterium]NIN11914.1 ornithine cyclodeaminase [Gemmatimonadales bacterium]NIN50464.1 ornithine cyclodeaminase [Gemmatimonadales bacterium]NIP07928.1 ornithine cyclodeaminase [Gemmatimonadales bacterium]NIR01952.1 ornithine cyclodeaminase [Gemmatimonadales bacterium]
MSIRVLSADDVRAALSMGDAVEAMRQAFGQLSDGTAELPLRTSVAVPDRGAVTLVMPARCDVPHGLGGKFVSVFPHNPKAGLPLIHAAVLLLSPETGEPVALIEGQSLTAIRTGAASGLATQLLARPDACRVAVIGSGVQARTQLEAVCCVRPAESVAVYSLVRQEVEQFAEEMAGTGGIPTAITVASSVHEATRDADIICTATSSADPVLAPDDISPGVHINGVGSYTAEMREVDPALVGRARVVVDQREAAMAEAGEVIAAVRGGLLAESALIELGEIVNGTAQGRTRDDQITLFKSVGVAVQDLCAGAQAVQRAEERGLGRVVEL